MVRQLQDGSGTRSFHLKSGVQSSAAIVGLSNGMPLASLAASRGFKVVGFDIDEVKVAQLEKIAGVAITSKEADLKGVGTYVISVPVPQRHGESDFQALEKAAELVGKHMSASALVIVESPVSIGASEKIVLPALERTSEIPRDNLLLAYCPQPLTHNEFARTPRVVGARTKDALERALGFYRELLDAEVLAVRSLKEAEAAGLLPRAAREVERALIDEFAQAFDKAGIDTVRVIKAAAAAGNPLPLPSVEMHEEVPADPYHLIRFGRKGDFEHQFLLLAHRVESGMPFFVARLLADALRAKKKSLKRSTIAILGISNSDGAVRAIQEGIQKRGAKVVTYDPHVLYASSARSLDEALKGASAAVLTIGRPEFHNLGPRDFSRRGVDIVIDACNCLKKDAFEGSEVTYRGLGR